MAFFHLLRKQLTDILIVVIGVSLITFVISHLIPGDPARLIAGERASDEIVAGIRQQLGLDLPLDVRGTAFQERVWQALRAIPVGSTASYAEVARLIGAPTATRAVAQACGANRLAVAIPCHRVVRSDGALSGYRWGVERKRQLLAREAR